MRKSSAKVGSVDICLPSGFGEEQAVTTRAENIHGVIARQIREAHRQNRLSLTKDTGTTAKCCRPVFLVHSMHSPICQNIPKGEGMD